MIPDATLTLELPDDSPTWDEPAEDPHALNEWRVQGAAWERTHGSERERAAPNPQPFRWIE